MAGAPYYEIDYPGCVRRASLLLFAACWSGSSPTQTSGGDRTLVDSTRPIHARTRVRVMARNVLLAIGWLTLAFYGLFLATVGVEGGA